MRWTMGARAAAVCVVVGSWMVACSGASSVGLGAGDAGTDGTTGSSSGGSSGGGSGGSSGADSAAARDPARGAARVAVREEARGLRAARAPVPVRARAAAVAVTPTAGGCTNLQCQVHSCTGGGTGTTHHGQGDRPRRAQPALQRRRLHPEQPRAARSTPSPSASTAASCSCGALFSGEPDRVRADRHRRHLHPQRTRPTGRTSRWSCRSASGARRSPSRRSRSAAPTDAGTITLPKNLNDGTYASMPEHRRLHRRRRHARVPAHARGRRRERVHGQPRRAPACTSSRAPAATPPPARRRRPHPVGQPGRPDRAYDIIMLSCEGSPTAGVSRRPRRTWRRTSARAAACSRSTTTTPSSPIRAPGTGYPQFTNVASWTNVGASATTRRTTTDITGVIEPTLPNGNAFPEGVALKAWLGNVGALNANGEIVVPVVERARHGHWWRASNVATPWVQTDPGGQPAEHAVLLVGHAVQPARQRRGRARVLRARRLQRHARVGFRQRLQRGNSVPTGCDADLGAVAGRGRDRVHPVRPVVVHRARRLHAAAAGPPVGRHGAR